ncbi:MarR family winged helix-turn-helix transcriptional regulator [Siphonobacter sp. SORGH_AS_1065]|uniref:MarR family winged helix-turn-helix transcriptional regulator n=1 Tax=Siphonobacter sp. SORGH_AS_1065 TaxID=3041795 RepID=UPI002787F458|nr:MarR family transcriptional regulator [Siphonobacter sp. SORGH_AS_1065]MDQ1089766.1 DNA-binding MarR family transcriptional regulator [Siphonobacter sp. SORGH_AS_1065]
MDNHLQDSIELSKQYFKAQSLVTMAFRQFIQYKLKIAKLDLTFEMLQVLSYLSDKEGVNQQEIANATVKDKASLTYLIDNLTGRELVYRQEDGQDRRNKLIFLTPKAKELLEVTLIPYIEEMYSRVTDNVSNEELKTVIEVINKMTTNLKV